MPTPESLQIEVAAVVERGVPLWHASLQPLQPSKPRYIPIPAPHQIVGAATSTR